MWSHKALSGPQQGPSLKLMAPHAGLCRAEVPVRPRVSWAVALVFLGHLFWSLFCIPRPHSPDPTLILSDAVPLALLRLPSWSPQVSPPPPKLLPFQQTLVSSGSTPCLSAWPSKVPTDPTPS